MTRASRGDQRAPNPHRDGAELPFDAVLFDMDGVVTDTAAAHAAAWKKLFDAVLADPRLNAGGWVEPFDKDADYLRYVDGRQREDGADVWSVHGLGARKNALFLDSVSRDGVRAYPGTTALLSRLRAGGVPVGLVTASRNSRTLLAAAKLAAEFDVVVDGQTAAEKNLPGKPDPAMFLEAARQLGASPERTAVIEDAAAASGWSSASPARGAATGWNRREPTWSSEMSLNWIWDPPVPTRGRWSTKGSTRRTRVTAKR